MNTNENESIISSAKDGIGSRILLSTNYELIWHYRKKEKQF